MSKLPHPEADSLFRGTRFELRAMRHSDGLSPARDWWDGLEEERRLQVGVAVELLSRALLLGRPTRGRAEAVASSRQELWVLRVHKAVAPPPHTRVLYIQRDTTLWAAHGSTREDDLTREEVAAADETVARWKQEGRT